MSDRRDPRWSAFGFGAIAARDDQTTRDTPTRFQMRNPTQRSRLLVYDRPNPELDSHHRERRLGLLIRRLPQRVQGKVHWLRQPSSRWVRIPAGVLLILCSFLFILPVFGLWMLPVGLILLADDIAPLRRLTDRWLQWIEQRRPHWMGLPQAPNPSLSQPE